jgi:hypothetical protein
MRSYIPHYHVGISTTCQNLFISLNESGGQSAGILNNLLAVDFEFWCSKLFQLSGKRANLMVVGTTLFRWKYCKIYSFFKFFSAKNDSRTRPLKLLCVVEVTI